MENNSKSGYDPDCINDSLGTAIRTVSYPCDTLEEKINVVTDKFHNNFYVSDKEYTLEERKSMFKAYFKAYYEDKATFNFYGLTVIEPF